MYTAALFLTLAVPFPAAPPQEAPDPERVARSAAYRYESLIRRRAPYRFGGGGGQCDEVIGRFCFHHGDEGTPSPAPEPEHPDVGSARTAAIRAFRRWLSVDPGNPAAAGGLIRYLIEDERSREAVSVARTHVWAGSGPGPWLLLGLAHHENGAFVSAEAAFDSARSRSTVEGRRRLDDVGVLLEPRERSAYERLDPERRAAYERRIWALSDPSQQVAGNERRSAHYARHAWNRILARAPRAEGMLPWGDDYEEITLRYGVPRSRERIRASAWQLSADTRMIETFDPHAFGFVPEELITEGVPGPPPPEGRRDPLVRSEYAPVRLHRTRPLRSQVTLIPTADGWLLRVDALLPPDTVAPRAPVDPRGLIAVMDSAGIEHGRVPARVDVRDDSSTVLRGEIPLPPGGTSWIYQAEVIDTASGLAGRQLAAVEIPDGPLRVSDPMLAPVSAEMPQQRTGLAPLPAPDLAPGSSVTVYTEVRGLQRLDGGARYSVEWWIESRDPPALLTRAVRLLGRIFGREPEPPTRVRWEAGSDAADPVVLTFALDVSGLEAGPYRLVLRVEDRVSGRSATGVRLLRVDPRAAQGLADAARPR